MLREINGQKIVNGGALQVAVSEISPGNTILLGILRNGKPENINVKVGEFHANTEVAENYNSARSNTESSARRRRSLPAVRQQFNIPTTSTGQPSRAFAPPARRRGGSRPGDVILEVNRKPVDHAENFVNPVHAFPAGKDILLLIWSRGGTTYRVLHTEEINSQKNACSGMGSSRLQHFETCYVIMPTTWSAY